jgi:hypothetical protein
MEKQFMELCCQGNLIGAQEFYQLNPTFDILEYNEKIFRWACKDGHLHVAEWIFQVSKEKKQSIHIWTIEDIFCWACEYGRLHVAQWLLLIKPELNISVKNEYGFRFACRGGYLNMAQWLLQVSKEKGKEIDISANVEEAFCWTCMNGHLEVAQWLLLISKERGRDIDISAKNEDAFRYACFLRHLHVAQWLLQVSGQDINISAENEEAFRTACKYGHLDVAQWLHSLKPNLYVIEYDENGKIKSYRIRDKEEANWQKRKYLVWLASNECPEENKHNLLYKLPSDVSRMVVGFL